MEIERPKRKQKLKVREKQRTQENIQNKDVMPSVSTPIKTENLDEGDINVSASAELAEECNEVTAKIPNDNTETSEADDQFTVDECAEATATDVADEQSKFDLASRASCPIIDLKEDIRNVNTFGKLMQANKDLMKDLKLSEIEVNKVTEQKEVKTFSTVLSCIKPYGESQLAALYINSELEAASQFSTQFVEAELKGIAVKRHPLYELLETYLQARSKLTGNMLECDQLRQEYKETHGQIWNNETAIVTGQGLCYDGVTVSASHSYNKATFHGASFQTVGRILKSLLKVVTETHVLYSYLSEVSRQQIELYLQTITTDFMNVSEIQQNAPVTLMIQNVAPNLVPILCEIRLCISVLFSFQRRLIRDAQFLKETRDWLSRLVALLLRKANWQDHLFLLNHVLRCPPGVGAWASSYVQTPLPPNLDGSPFSNFQVNHVMAILSVILMPVQKREQFLEQIAQSRENPEEALWVIVDSEGEEDEELSGTALRENDLVQLFNQLPLDNLFRVSMFIQHHDGQDHFDPNLLTEHHLLRFLSFSTVFLRILHRGLNTYMTSRYHQFSKRLCRSIRHIVQYVTDQWEYFKNNNKMYDLAMLERLQVEYDAFFLRATHYLYSSQRMGAWQFLAVVPYHMVSIKILWRIFYLLHNNEVSSEMVLDPTDTTNYQVKVWDEALRNQFEEKLNSLDDAESYYLLNTFANMALARQDIDMEFIRAAMMNLLQVGFISETTQESCCKTARILLTHITSRHSHLISDILICFKKNFDKVGELSLYLFEELPLSVWLPSENDMECIAAWLIQSLITTDQSRLARMILSRLNWGFASERALFLTYGLHFKVALLLAQIVEQELGYLQWAWQTAFRLRLHITDKGFTDLSRIAELDNIGLLSKGVREQKPFPCFLGLLMTSWGHLVPLICTKGLPLLEILQIHQKYDAILYVLNLIVPLFINCQESLINCEKFQSVLLSLLNADKTYVNMAKNLIITHNPILEQFGNMIEYQMENFKWYNLDSPKFLVRLWMNSLVSIPNWNKDPGILYLLDIIVKDAFFYSDALDAAIIILKELLQNTTPQENTSIISLFKWASQSNTPQGTLLTSNSLPSCAWLAYVLIGLEHEEREKQTGFWKELLVQLKYQKGKVNVDSAIKKAASAVKVPSFTSSSLCIYRWAQQALYTPLEHPLVPLLWQGFFTLFLARVSIVSVSDKGCVGDKFFDGIVNLSFLKRLKKRLFDSTEYYQKQTEECDINQDVNRKCFYENCQRLFRAYSLWLEEPRLQEGNIHLPSLPPQYQPQLIALIMQGSSFPWLEYIDNHNVKLEQQKSIKLWRTLTFREKTNVNQPLPNPGSGIESADPVERILRRLASYDVPKPAPAIIKSAPIVPNVDIKNRDAVKKLLDIHFQTLNEFARNHSLRVSEYKAIDLTYRDLVKQLYRSVMYKIKKQVVCQGSGGTACSGAATITLEMQESRINEGIEHQIQVNRNDYELMLSKSLQAPAQSLCMASVSIQKTISLMQTQKNANSTIPEMAVELFYQILSLMSDEVMFYPPTAQFLNACLQKLGQTFISGVEFETPRILSKILAEPKLVSLLSPYFVPVNVGTFNFLHMYSTLCDGVINHFKVAYPLLLKFDILNWLNVKQPKVRERTHFVELVINGLRSLNQNPPTESLSLHELYCKHLVCIFEFEFPEHYGDVLMALLKNSISGTATGRVSVNVWIEVLNSLSKPLKLKCNPLLRDQLRQCAQQQHLLNYQRLLETAVLFANFYSNERKQCGVHGLYPIYRNYIDVLILFIGMTVHALIISALNTHQDLLGDKICEIIWPYLKEVFAPWVLPYWINNTNEDPVAGMQQSDDRAVLLPWITADGPLAHKAVHMLFECVQFIIHTLPACNNILSFVWQWYATSFAHPTVKEHVLNVIHASFLALSWNNFWPSVTDLEFMLKVVEQYLPECHTFLGHIFMEISWTNWISQLSSTAPPQVMLRVHQCLLYLLVKLPSEPNVRSNHSQKAKALLVHAEAFNWDIIEPTVFMQILDWYIVSCDPLVLFSTDPMNLDFRVLHFLQRVAHYDRPTEVISLPILQKRHIYLRSFIKLMSIFVSKHRNLVRSKENELNGIIACSLVHIEFVVKSEDELKVLMEEMFSILNIDGIKDVATMCFQKWIASKSSQDVVLKVALQVIGSSVGDCDVAALLYETACNSYFQNNNASENTWKRLATCMKPYPPRQAQLEQVLLVQGKILTLNALLIQKAAVCSDSFSLLNSILHWLNNLKVITSFEDKLPLLWSEFLALSLTHCNIDEAGAGSVLYKFAQLLIQTCGERGVGGWGKGILGAIGLVKQEGLTLKFRFLCRAIAAYVLAQLPDVKRGVQTVRHSSKASAAVGQPGGNTECVKLLLGLDFGQSQGEIKSYAELALKQIQDPSNSLHTAQKFLALMVNQLYTKPYLRDIDK